ncbi:MAG: hypothetical protein Q8L22_02065 [Reyranella sp.]|nr:hypothetical protein [Reyranella sp.]
MDDFSPERPTPAMCAAWRLFRDHGKDAEGVVEGELARCLRSGDRDGATEWRRVAEALVEWCR